MELEEREKAEKKKRGPKTGSVSQNSFYVKVVQEDNPHIYPKEKPCVFPFKMLSLLCLVLH